MTQFASFGLSLLSLVGNDPPGCPRMDDLDLVRPAHPPDQAAAELTAFLVRPGALRLDP